MTVSVLKIDRVGCFVVALFVFLMPQFAWAQFLIPYIETAKFMGFRGAPKSVLVKSQENPDRRMIFDRQGRLIESTYPLVKRVGYEGEKPVSIVMSDNDGVRFVKISISRHDEQGRPLFAAVQVEDAFYKSKAGAIVWKYSDGLTVIEEYGAVPDSAGSYLIAKSEISVNESSVLRSFVSSNWLSMGGKTVRVDGGQVYSYKSGLLLSITNGRGDAMMEYSGVVVDDCGNWVTRVAARYTSAVDFGSMSETQEIEYYEPCAPL